MNDYEISITDSAVREMSNAQSALANISDVNTDVSAVCADAALKQAKALVKSVHDQRMSVTRRLDAAKKMCIAREAEICSGLNKEIERVGGLCTTYLVAKEKAREAERKAEEERLAEARAAAEAEAAITGAPVEVDVTGSVPSFGKLVDGVSSRTAWTFDIIDANAVPRAYCVPDSALIRAYMMEAKKSGADISSLSIPGVAFRKEIRV